MNKTRIRTCIRSINLFLSLDENLISSKLDTPRLFPKQQILIEPEMPPIPDSDSEFETFSTELETATPEADYVVQRVKTELKPLEDLPKAEIAEFVSTESHVEKLTELDEAAKNIQMPKK